MTTSHTLTGNFADIVGGSARPRSVLALLSTNLGGDALVDLDANEISLPGSVRIPLNDDLAFSLDLIATNSTGTNVTDGSLRYKVDVQWIDAARQPRSWSSGWFALTAAIDLSDVVAEVFLPPTFVSESIAAMEAIRDEVELISGLTGEDTAVSALVNAPASDTRSALDGLYAGPGVDATQRFMSIVSAGLADASVLVVGDSTGNETSEWVYKLGQQLATLFPTHTIAYRLWNDGGSTYDAATTIATGSGARTVTIYNASIPGSGTHSWHGARAEAAIYALTPDLTLISHGHNEQALSAPEWHARYVALTESITARLATDLILVAQNPATANTYQQQRREVYREIAARRGYGFIDVCQAFIDTGDAPGLTVDGLHPTVAGSDLWAETVAAAFVSSKKASPRPQQPSTLTVAGESLLRNGDFRDGVNFWTLTAATSAVDTANFETAANTTAAPTTFTSTARKFTAAGAGASFHQYVPPTRARGQWVTLAVRMYVPAGQPSTAGRVSLGDSTGSTTTLASTDGQGGFRWTVVTRFIPTTATNCRALIYVDSAGGVGNNITVDRVVMTVGKYPHEAAQSLPGATGAAGLGSLDQNDFISTVGNHPMIASVASMSGSNQGVGGANQAFYSRIIPHRNVTVTGLVWQATTPSGNYDIGIFNAAGTLLWSKGSTAFPAAGLVTETVPSIALAGGTPYYIGFTIDNTTALLRMVLAQFADHTRLLDGTPTSLLKSGSFPLASGALGSTGVNKIPIVMLRGT